ncbi:hypothetical protein ACSNOI_20370 [Actinomadura kijaniata]|uniref:hypothetical protein n=1 Tax=Actinomadura kijaniata TaxID=46161 RepID=UPI003F1CC015
METMGFDWEAVVHRDFDVDLDQPGRRSGEALGALLADLGVPADAEGSALVGEWPDDLRRALDAGLPALLERLAHPDVGVRRILAVALTYTWSARMVPAVAARIEREPDAPTRLGLLVALGAYADDPEVAAFLRRHLDGDPASALGAALAFLLHAPSAVDEPVLDTLTLCAGEAGEALRELAWCDPEWSGPVEAVDGWLWRTPELRSRWLDRMFPLLWNDGLATSSAAVLVEAADRLFRDDRDRHAHQASAVTALLAHPDPGVRRAALKAHNLYKDDAYADTLVGVLDDPDLSGRALLLLTHRGDPRCVSALRRRITAGEAASLREAKAFADALWPDVRARLSETTDPAEIETLLRDTADWPGGTEAVPEVIGVLERLSRDLLAHPDPGALEAAARSCGFLRKRALTDERALAVLRGIAAGPNLEIALAAIRALMGLGERADPEIVTLLLGVLSRRDVHGRQEGRRGWRYDCNACAWLGELGPRARAAAPTLRVHRDTSPVDPLRVEAAAALWRITRDPAETLPTLIPQIPNDPMRVLHRLVSMGKAALPALPAIRAHTEGDGDLAKRAREAVRHLESL